MEPVYKTDPPARRGIPLAFFFYLWVVSATLFSALRWLDFGQIILGVNWQTAIVATSASGIVLGSLVGAVVFRRLSAMLWGAPVGLLVGAVAGELALVPIEHVPRTFTVSAIAGLIFIAVASMIARFSRQPE